MQVMFRPRDPLEQRELDSAASLVYLPPPEHKFRERQPGELRRPIIIDGISLGSLYRPGRNYSEIYIASRGILIAVLYFTLRGHKTVVLLPEKNIDASDTSKPEILIKLKRLKLLMGPNGHGKSLATRKNLRHQIIRHAQEMGGCIASSDQFREFVQSEHTTGWENAAKELIKYRLLMPSYSEDNLIFPPDGPMGRLGQTFEETLKCDEASCRPSLNHQLSLSDQCNLLQELMNLDSPCPIFDAFKLLQSLNSEVTKAVQMRDVEKFCQGPVTQSPKPRRVSSNRRIVDWSELDNHQSSAPTSSIGNSGNTGTNFPVRRRVIALHDPPPPVQASSKNSDTLEKLQEIFGDKKAKKLMSICSDFDGSLDALVEFVMDNPDLLGDDEFDTIPDIQSNIAPIETQQRSTEELDLINF